MRLTSPQDLLTQWQTDSLSIEEGLTQLLQHLVNLTNTLTQVKAKQTAMQHTITGQSVSWAALKTEVDELQAQVVWLQGEVQRLSNQAGLPPATQRKKG